MTNKNEKGYNHIILVKYTNRYHMTGYNGKFR